MKTPSYLRRRRRALAVHWRVAHWIVVTMCALIVTYSSGAWTRAIDGAAPSAGRAAIACAASGADCVAAPATFGSHNPQTLAHPRDLPSSEPGDLWFDLDEEEDEDAHDRSGSTSDRSLSAALGLRHPAGAHEGSLTPPGPSAATLFLTESVRRM